MILNLLNLYSLIFAQFNKINDMVKELEILYNATTQSNVSVSTKTQIPSSNNTSCLQVCSNLTPTVPLLLTTLATAIVLNITTTSLPKLLESVSSPATLDFTTDFATVASESTAKDYVSTLLNLDLTDEVLNSTSESYINGSGTPYSELNETASGSAETREAFWLLNSLDDFKDKFEDYLSYILNAFEENDNSTSIFDFPDYDYYANITTKNATPTTDFLESLTREYLQSTLPTVFNMTDGEVRFESEIATFYDEVASTIAWVQENATRRPELCRGCASVLINKPEVLILPSDTQNTSCTGKNSSVALPKGRTTYAYRSKLRSLCWETMFGQELVKLTVMDLVFTAMGIIAVDFIRGLFVRIMNKCWCWDLEKKFPEYGEFKVAENILHLVNNQGLVWMGMFFSPGLLLINVFKLTMLMYLRSWAVMTCNVPHAVIFRASRSNNFYFALLLTMLFLCVLPVGYAVVWVRPSWHCGPFSQYDRMFHIFTDAIKEIVPTSLHKTLDYIASPGIVIPLLILLILIIYYLISLTNALREANEDLKVNPISLLGWNTQVCW